MSVKDFTGFRTLRADEIECRIGNIYGNGLTLLLYKDARCDMNLLDETFGHFGWKRRHSRDNANCTVLIYDDVKKEWIDKEDVGVESYSEKEKGLASDSFKRSCINWGIGRELYTAPDIRIYKENCNIEAKKDSRNTKNIKYVCYDKFEVVSISYDKYRSISALSIRNVKTGKIVFTYPKNIGKSVDDLPKEGNSNAKAETQKASNTFSEEEFTAILEELSRTGIGVLSVCGSYGAKTLNTVPRKFYKEIIDRLKAKPDKVLDPDTIPPENDDQEDLPWNAKTG